MFDHIYKRLIVNILYNNYDILELNYIFRNIIIKSCLYKNNFCQIELRNDSEFKTMLWLQNDDFILNKTSFKNFISEHEDMTNILNQLKELVDQWETESTDF